jgi:hypothetical protein
MDNIIVSFEADVNGLVPAVDMLQKIGKISAEDAAAAKKMAADWKAQQQAVTQGTQQSVSQIEKFANSFKNLTGKITGGAINNTFNDIIAVMQQLDPESAKLVSEFQKLGQSGDFAAKAAGVLKQQLANMTPGTDEYNQLDAAINKLEAGMAELAAESGNAGDAVSDAGDAMSAAEKKASSIRTRLRALREEMAALEANNEGNSDRFRELQAEAGKLTDEFGDVQQSINYLASDTKGLDAAMSLGSGVAGAFNAATSAAALLGGESEELQEAFLKVQAALGVLNGVQAVANALNKNSNIIEGIKYLQTLAQTKATELQTQATIRATIAQRAMNLVAKANPYVLLAVAVATVAGAIGAYFLATSKARREQRALTEEINKTKEAFSNYDTELQRTLERLDALGSSEMAKFEARQAIITKKQTDFLKTYAGNINKLSKEEKEDVVKTGRALVAEQQKIYDDTNNHRLKSGREFAQKEREAFNERADRQLQDIIDIQQKIIDSENDDYDTRLKNANEQYNDTLKLVNQQEAAKLESVQKGSQQAKNIQDEFASKRADAYDKQQENITKIEQTAYDKRLKTIEQHLTAIQGYRDEAYQQELIDASTQYAKGELNEEEYQRRKEEIARKYAKSSAEGVIEITQWALDTQNLSDKDREAFEKQLAEAKKQLAKEVADAEIAENDRKGKKTIEQEQQLQEALKELKTQAIDFAMNLVAMQFSQQKAALDQELADLQNYYTTDAEEAKKNKNKKLISEEELARRTAEIKNKQAAVDKQQQVVQATMAAFAGAAKALPNLPLAAVVLAFGLAQAALIQAQPLPKYWKGRQGGPGEYAVVGEYGPEMMWVPPGANILPAHKTNTMLRAMEISKQWTLPPLNIIPSFMPNINSERGTSPFAFDYDRLGDAIARNTPEVSQFNVNMDEDGFGKFLVKGNNSTKVLNKRSFT